MVEAGRRGARGGEGDEAVGGLPKAVGFGAGAVANPQGIFVVGRGQRSGVAHVAVHDFADLRAVMVDVFLERPAHLPGHDVEPAAYARIQGRFQLRHAVVVASAHPDSGCPQPFDEPVECRDGLGVQLRPARGVEVDKPRRNRGRGQRVAGSGQAADLRGIRLQVDLARDAPDIVQIGTQDPDMIEGGPDGVDTGHGERPDRGLVPDDSAIGRGSYRGAPGLGAERDRNHAGGDRRGRAAR